MVLICGSIETQEAGVRDGSLWVREANTRANSAPLDPTAALLASLLKSPLHPCGDAEPINSPSHPGLVHHSELVIDILEIALVM